MQNYYAVFDADDETQNPTLSFAPINPVDHIYDAVHHMYQEAQDEIHSLWVMSFLLFISIIGFGALYVYQTRDKTDPDASMEQYYDIDPYDEDLQENSSLTATDYNNKPPKVQN